MDELTRKGLRRIARELVPINDWRVHKRLNLYIDIGPHCNADCGFCVAKTRDQKHRIRNLSRMLESSAAIREYCYSVEFVGGEPLVYINNGLKELFEVFRANRKKIITTNGLRQPFLASLDFLGEFEHVNISRHAVDDAHNEQIFRTGKLLTLADIGALPPSLKQKIRMNTTCHADKGIHQWSSMWEFIQAFNDQGIHQFMFANLNKLPQGQYQEEMEAFTTAHRLDDGFFDDVEHNLCRQGYHKVREMTGFGYVVRILQNGSTSVVLKENDDTAIRDVLDSVYQHNRMVLDLILTPSGKVYTDWFLTNELPITPGPQQSGTAASIES
ncbi:radical SAM protein [Archangium violaceum]|uniref:radical SAM protein n=1 Tax=Archangium violaceum TaxID=83451 RepID=UPI00194E39E3|nr:radical SAM protein [Archangium violaceum]QRO00843.1 radical SAM protein [Archangium violaceum]